MIRLRPNALRRVSSCIEQLYGASHRPFTTVAPAVEDVSLEKDESTEEAASEAVAEALTPPHYIFPPSQTDTSALESDLWTFLGPEGFPEEFLVVQFLKDKLDTEDAVNALEAHDCIVVFRMVERFIRNGDSKKEVAPILGLVLQRLEDIAPQASKRLISVLLSTLNSVGQWASEYSDLRQAAEGLGKRLLTSFVENRKEFATPPRYLGRVCRFLVEYPGCSTPRVVEYIDTVSTELLRAGGTGSLEEDMTSLVWLLRWWSTQTLSSKMHIKEVRERIKEALVLVRNNAAGLSHEHAVIVLEACGRLPPMKGMSKVVYQAKLRLLREPWLSPIGPSIAALGKLGAWNKSCRSMYLMLAHKASLPGMGPESLSAMVGGGLATTTQNLGRKEEPDIVGEPQPRNAAFPRKEFIVAAIQKGVLDDVKKGGMKLTAVGNALWAVCVGGLHLEMPQGVKQTPTERPWKLTGFEDGKELLLRSLADVSLVCGRCRGGSPGSLAGSYTESLQVWTQFGEALHYLALTNSPLVNLTEPEKAMVRVHKKKDVDSEYIRNHKRGLQWAKEEQLKWMDESLVAQDIAKYIEKRSPGALQLTDENISSELAALVELPVFHVGDGFILDIDCPEISPVGRALRKRIAELMDPPMMYHVIDGLSWMDRSPSKKEEVIQQYSSEAERSQVLCDSRGLWINVLHRPKKDQRRPVVRYLRSTDWR